MKKVSLMVMGAIVALGTVFTSCKKTETTAATIELLASSTQSGAKVTPAGAVNLNFIVTKGSNDLSKVDIVFDNKVVKSYPADSLKTSPVTLKYATVAPATLGTAKYTINVYDKASESVASVSSDVTITVEGAAVALTAVHTGVVLGNANASAGSYYSITGGVLTQTAAEASATSIAFAYNGEVISPSAVSNSKISTANAARITKFKTVTTIDFAKATTADLAAITIDGTSAVATEGAVIAFVTQEGVKGLLKITAKTLTGTGTTAVSTITISVKK